MKRIKNIVEIRKVALNNIRTSINRLNSMLCSNYDKDIYTYKSYLADTIGYNEEKNLLFTPCFTAFEYKDKGCLCCVNLSDIGYVIYDLNLISEDDKKLLDKPTEWLEILDKTLATLIEYLEGEIK